MDDTQESSAGENTRPFKVKGNKDYTVLIVNKTKTSCIIYVYYNLEKDLRKGLTLDNIGQKA